MRDQKCAIPFGFAACWPRYSAPFSTVFLVPAVVALTLSGTKGRKTKQIVKQFLESDQQRAPASEAKYHFHDLTK